MRKSTPTLLLAAAALVLLGGCSEKGEVDPYIKVSLQEVTRSTVISRGFKYKLVNPQIVALNRNIGLIREGNLLEFIGARSLEDKIKGMTDGYYEMNVVKKFSPYVHFRVDQFITEADTIMTNQRGALAFPLITTPEAFGIENYEERALERLRWNDTQGLQKIKDEKIRTAGPILVENIDGKEQYYLQGKNAKLRISETGDAMGLMLKYFVDMGYEFDGGITLVEIEPFGDRRNTKVAGTVEIKFIRFGDRLITG